MATCEHEWVQHAYDDTPGIYMCIEECGQERTVADLWKPEPPEGPTESKVWFIEDKFGWTEPKLMGMLTAEYWGNFPSEVRRLKFWHGPGAIIVEPPTP